MTFTKQLDGSYTLATTTEQEANIFDEVLQRMSEDELLSILGDKVKDWNNRLTHEAMLKRQEAYNKATPECKAIVDAALAMNEVK